MDPEEKKSDKFKGTIFISVWNLLQLKSELNDGINMNIQIILAFGSNKLGMDIPLSSLANGGWLS